jgi:hypothetical protein
MEISESWHEQVARRMQRKIAYVKRMSRLGVDE